MLSWILWGSVSSRCFWLLQLPEVPGKCVTTFNTLRPRKNGRHFPDNFFKYIFLNENVWIPIKISLKFVPGGPNNKFPALVQIMAWRRSGDKPLSELMMVSLLTHICVTRPQWVNWLLLGVRLVSHCSKHFWSHLWIIVYAFDPVWWYLETSFFGILFHRLE